MKSDRVQTQTTSDTTTRDKEEGDAAGTTMELWDDRRRWGMGRRAHCSTIAGPLALLIH